MKIEWSNQAIADLARLHAFLAPEAPDAAAWTLEQLARAPHRLMDFPRLGEKLDLYLPREVRRIRVGRYEMRYEIVDATITIVRLWHHREDRP